MECSFDSFTSCVSSVMCWWSGGGSCWLTNNHHVSRRCTEEKSGIRTTGTARTVEEKSGIRTTGRGTNKNGIATKLVCRQSRHAAGKCSWRQGTKGMGPTDQSWGSITTPNHGVWKIQKQRLWAVSTPPANNVPKRHGSTNSAIVGGDGWWRRKNESDSNLFVLGPGRMTAEQWMDSLSDQHTNDAENSKTAS